MILINHVKGGGSKGVGVMVLLGEGDQK
jgi:hypothetical protein